MAARFIMGLTARGTTRVLNFSRQTLRLVGELIMIFQAFGVWVSRVAIYVPGLIPHTATALILKGCLGDGRWRRGWLHGRGLSVNVAIFLAIIGRGVPEFCGNEVLLWVAVIVVV